MTFIDLEDRRRKERRRATRCGSIMFGDMVLPCLLRCQSPSGVALDVMSSTSIPDQFKLLTEAKVRSCAVVWRKEQRIGAAFY
jgi:hypothetical protein